MIPARWGEVLGQGPLDWATDDGGVPRRLVPVGGDYDAPADWMAGVQRAPLNWQPQIGGGQSPHQFSQAQLAAPNPMERVAPALGRWPTPFPHPWQQSDDAGALASQIAARSAPMIAPQRPAGPSVVHQYAASSTPTIAPRRPQGGPF